MTANLSIIKAIYCAIYRGSDHVVVRIVLIKTISGFYLVVF
jgi:hypothetical protein